MVYSEWSFQTSKQKETKHMHTHAFLLVWTVNRSPAPSPFDQCPVYILPGFHPY